MSNIINFAGKITGRVKRSAKKNYRNFRKGFGEGEKINCKECKECFDDKSDNYYSIIDFGKCVFCKTKQDIIGSEKLELVRLKSEKQKLKKMRKADLKKMFGDNWTIEQSKVISDINKKIEYLTQDHQHIILDPDDLKALLRDNRISKSDIESQDGHQISSKIKELIEKGEIKIHTTSIRVDKDHGDNISNWC